MSEVKIRLENEKRLYVVELKGDTFKIVSGSLKGTVTAEEHRMLEGSKGRNVEQEALVKVAKLVEAKIKIGYGVTKGDVEILRAEAAKVLNMKSTVVQTKRFLKLAIDAYLLDQKLALATIKLKNAEAELKDMGVNMSELMKQVQEALTEKTAKAKAAKAKAAKKVVSKKKA